MEIKTFWQVAEIPEDKKVYEINNEPSMTVDDGYEDLSDMIPRIIRGELPPMRPSYYELQGNITDDDFDRPVVDGLDDLTDIDAAQEIISSALRNRATESPANEEAEDGKHGAPEVKDSEAATNESQPKAV